MNRLNLGCGNDYMKGWVNAEYDKRCKADLYFNINELNFPFKDGEFDYIFFNHVIEHLSPETDIVELLKELNRILKVGGILELNCPHYSGWNAFGKEHTRYYNFRSFIYVPKFEVVSAGLYNTIKHWTTDPNHKFGFFANIFNKTVEFLANLNPLLCERLWAHWVGGFMEQRFILRKVA
jgi:SAM-dependent methyltransferase